MHRFIRVLVLGFLSLVLVLPFAGVGCAPKPPAPTEIYKARCSTYLLPVHYPPVYAEKFAQLCREETKGRLDIEIYHSGILYGFWQTIPAVSQGEVQMGGALGTLFALTDPNFMADTMMLLFDNYEQQRKVWETEPGKAAINRVEQKLGVKLLVRLPAGPMHIWNAKRPLVKVEDFKDLKIRIIAVAEKPAYEALQAICVTSVPSHEEIYAALQQETVDALASSTWVSKSYGWWKFTKYASLPYVAYPDFFLFVNAEWWNSLPEDIRDIVLKKVAPEIEKEAVARVMDDHKAVLDEFARKGGTVTTMSPETVKALKKLAQNSVYPPLVERLDPAFWEVIRKQQGLEK